GDHLPGIRRVRKNLLIAAHGCVEYHLANGDTVGADGGAPENTAVCKGQDGGSVGRRCQIHLLIVARPVPISARRRRAESRLVPGGSKLLWVNGLGLEVANSRLKKSEMKRNGFISLFGVLNSVQRYACTAMFRPGYLRCCAPAKSDSALKFRGRKLGLDFSEGALLCPLLMAVFTEISQQKATFSLLAAGCTASSRQAIASTSRNYLSPSTSCMS